MSRTVTAAASQRGVYLPNGKVLSGGKSTVLSDAHFALVGTLVSAGVLVDGGATGANPDVPTPGVETDPVASAALPGKAALVHTHVANDVTDATSVGKAVMTAANATAARTAIGAVLPRVYYEFPVAAGAQTVRTSAQRIYNDTGRTLTLITARASVLTAPTGASLIVDISKNGTTIFTTQSNRPTIAAAALTATAAAVQVTAWAPGEYLTFSVAQIGSTVAGSDLTVSVVAEG